MNPYKERALRMFHQPSRRMVDDISGAPLQRMVTIFAGARRMEPRVKRVKAALESGRASAIGVEYQRSHKGSSLVTAVFQQIWKVGQIRAQGGAEVADMIELRIGPTQQRSMRGRCQRHLCIGASENDTLMRQCVKIRS